MSTRDISVMPLFPMVLGFDNPETRCISVMRLLDWVIREILPSDWQMMVSHGSRDENMRYSMIKSLKLALTFKSSPLFFLFERVVFRIWVPNSVLRIVYIFYSN
ncbi:hypothetical protein S245_033325 [Arachis hypogaea]